MSSSGVNKDELESLITTGDLQAIADLYQAAGPSSQPAIRTLVAKRAAFLAQPKILDWCFQVGYEIPENSANNEMYEQASYSSSPAVFDVLLAHGLDLNKYDSESFGDALSLAAHHGDVSFARFLLERGADPDQTRGLVEYEAAVWTIAGANPSVEILQLMLRHGWTQTESTAHIAAAELGNMEALRLLIEADPPADLECADPWWSIPTEGAGEPGTALYRAALKGREEAVRYLLSKGANPDFTDGQGRSCAWAAKEGGNEKVIGMLDG